MRLKEREDMFCLLTLSVVYMLSGAEEAFSSLAQKRERRIRPLRKGKPPPFKRERGDVRSAIRARAVKKRKGCRRRRGEEGFMSRGPP